MIPLAWLVVAGWLAVARLLVVGGLLVASLLATDRLRSHWRDATAIIEPSATRIGWFKITARHSTLATCTGISSPQRSARCLRRRNSTFMVSVILSISPVVINDLA